MRVYRTACVPPIQIQSIRTFWPSSKVSQLGCPARSRRDHALGPDSNGGGRWRLRCDARQVRRRARRGDGSAEPRPRGYRLIVQPLVFVDGRHAVRKRRDASACRSQGHDGRPLPERPGRVEHEPGKLLAAIKAGGPIEGIVGDMKRFEAGKAELKDQFANAEEPPPLLHPNMAENHATSVATDRQSGTGVECQPQQKWLEPILKIRKPLLYPAELRGHTNDFNAIQPT
jgi:hypothetical protein